MGEERRLVTVLFADVVGSTALGERTDPEDVRALLARFYALAREIINSHGGTLEKFIGDAVMAVFGLPQAHGDDPERALAAALALRDRVRTDVRLGHAIPVRVGVNTGEVVATKEHRASDFLVTGDAVNVAARLQQAAEPWAILCGERTARATRGFAFATPRAIEAKGKSDPVLAVPVVGRVPVATPHVPLVGRKADLAQLELAARRVFAERRPFLVTLIAPAGTGKTRLLEEFLDHLPDLTANAVVATAQCVPYGQRLTYWPLRAMLFRLADLSDEAPAGTIRQGLLTWVEALSLPDAQRTAELLAATVGAGETDVADQTALFMAWRNAVESAAQRRPLVLVFEDLHWSSDSLLNLVEFLMQPRSDAPILMLALARPELLDRRPAWGGGRRNFLALALEPLSDADIARFVEYLLGVSAPQLVARILERAEGNPFYAGEMVRSILERVISVGDAPALEIALAALPDTVQATVLARLDLLPEVERRVLQLGSVFGRTFTHAGVVALSQDLAAKVELAADQLLVRDLLRVQDNADLTFRHILIREVAYSTLPRAERARLHALAGRWLEDMAAGREDALAELIAYHYREAASLARVVQVEEVDFGPVRLNAVRWLRRAAEVAAAGAAHSEAARHLRGAIDLADADALPDLYERLGDVTSGDAALDAYSMAFRLASEAGRKPDLQLRALAGFLTMCTRFYSLARNRPSPERILELRTQAQILAAQARDKRAITRFLIAEAFYPYGLGVLATEEDLQKGEVSGRQALDLAEQLDDYHLLSAALDGLASIAMTRSDWEAVKDTSRRRLVFQDRLDFSERTDAHAMVAFAATTLGDLKEADQVTAMYLDSLRPGQAADWALHPVAWRVYALMLSGKWVEALVAAERAVALYEESGRGTTGFVHGFLAALDIARARQDALQSERYLAVLQRVLSGFPTEEPAGWMRPYLGPDLDALERQVIWAFQTIPPPRWHLVERALALCADLGHLPSPEAVRPIAEVATARKARILAAQARRALGLSVRNSADLERALEMFEQAGAVPYLARTQCELALLHNDEAAMMEGLHALEDLGDLSQLARFRRLRGR